MRYVYLVAYDISDTTRLYQVHKTMLGFGDPFQFSVFICLLSPKERILMLDSLNGLIKKDEDRIMVVTLGPEGTSTSEHVEFLGLRKELPSRKAVVV